MTDDSASSFISLRQHCGAFRGKGATELNCSAKARLPPAVMLNKVKAAIGKRRSRGKNAAAAAAAATPSFHDLYILGPILGKGAFSVVHLATRRSDGARFATKVVPRRRLPAVDEAALRLEAQVLLAIDHPHIVRLVAWFEEKDTFYVLLELCEGGSFLTASSRSPSTARGRPGTW